MCWEKWLHLAEKYLKKKEQTQNKQPNKKYSKARQNIHHLSVDILMIPMI